MHSSGRVPPGFRFSIERVGFASYKLHSAQVIPIAREGAFQFFEDPLNLSHIIPDWVNFSVIDKGSDRVVRKGSEFNYTLSWLGIPLRWRSRITEYEPPEHFTDIQLKGPYASWVHAHTMEDAPGGTLMRDEIAYTIPCIAVPVHGLIIKRQLSEIFRYRAERIADWARSRKAGAICEE